MFTRRDFMKAAGAATLAGRLAWAAPPRSGGRKRVAIVTTVWRYLSHAQHMGDRFLVGYPVDGEWHQPNLDVVSLYVDQKPAGDQSQARAKEFGFTVYPTIAEALRCGGKKLAVDAIIIIGEHGKYPWSEKGQILYPRYKFFEQVVDVFERDGRCVPVFNDKHLSYSRVKARKMVETSKRLGFPMLAGSSLPVSWRLPALELPLDCVIEEALMISPESREPMSYHALEAMQCMVERRKGGETGVKAVQIVEGDAVWEAGEQGRWSKELLEAALSRSDTIGGLTREDSRPQDLVHSGELQRLVRNPTAFIIERSDGSKTALLTLPKGVRDFDFAVKVDATPPVQSTQFYLPPLPNVTYSACLMSKVEEMIETGKPPYPVERTQIVSEILDRCLDSKIQGHKRLETPELNVRYRAPRASQFART